MKTISKKRIDAAVVLALLVAAVMFGVSATQAGVAALWHVRVNSSANPFTTSTTSPLTQKTGSNSAVGDQTKKVTSTFDNSLRDSLNSSGVAYGLTTYTANVGAQLQMSYKIDSVAATGVFASDTTTIKTMIVPTGTCNSSSTGTVVYEGVLKNQTTSAITLTEPRATSGVVNSYLCSVITAPLASEEQTHTVTVTGDTAAGQVTESEDHTITVEGQQDTVGTLSVTSSWTSSR